MNIIRLTSKKGEVFVKPAAKSGGFTYAWDEASFKVDFNDGGESFQNTLTTNDPSDPITYLQFDPAFLTNVSTSDNGDGTWQVLYDTVVNAGSSSVSNTKLIAHNAILTIIFPGFVYQDISVNTGSFAQTYEINSNPATLPLSLNVGDNASVIAALATATAIHGTVFVSDNRMASPTWQLVSGNGTIGGGFGTITSHSCSMALTSTENSPFGGTTVVALCPEMSITINNVMGI